MIALDTDVLVRYIMQDDRSSHPVPTRLIESLTGEEPGFIPLVALVELVWLLSTSYELARAQVRQVLEGLLRSRALRMDRADVVTQAMRQFSAGAADFADCLIERIAADAGGTDTMTFDVAAARSAGLRLIGA